MLGACLHKYEHGAVAGAVAKLIYLKQMARGKRRLKIMAYIFNFRFCADENELTNACVVSGFAWRKADLIWITDSIVVFQKAKWQTPPLDNNLGWLGCLTGINSSVLHQSIHSSNEARQLLLLLVVRFTSRHVRRLDVVLTTSILPYFLPGCLPERVARIRQTEREASRPKPKPSTN